MLNKNMTTDRVLARKTHLPMQCWRQTTPAYFNPAPVLPLVSGLLVVGVQVPGGTCSNLKVSESKMISVLILLLISNGYEDQVEVSRSPRHYVDTRLLFPMTDKRTATGGTSRDGGDPTETSSNNERKTVVLTREDLENLLFSSSIKTYIERK